MFCSLGFLTQGDSLSQSQHLAVWPSMDPHCVFFLCLDYSFCFLALKKMTQISLLWNYLEGHTERSVFNKMRVQRVVIPSHL